MPVPYYGPIELGTTALQFTLAGTKFILLFLDIDNFKQQLQIFCHHPDVIKNGSKLFD